MSLSQSAISSTSRQRFGYDFKTAAPLTPMSRTTRLSEVPAPRAIRVGNDEVVSGSGGLGPFLSECKDEKSYKFD